jgi:hypothetical protein
VPLQAAQPPEAADRIAATNLMRLANSLRGELSPLGGADASELAFALPHPVYTMTLTDLLNHRSIGDIKTDRLTGWRYLVQDHDRTIASVEVAVNPQTEQMRFSQIQSAPVAQATEASIRTAQEFKVVRKEPFEVRLLRVPALYTVALWLRDRGEGEQNDLLVPVAPAPPGLEANRAYRARMFFKVLYERALERSENDPALAADEGQMTAMS